MIGLSCFVPFATLARSPPPGFRFSTSTSATAYGGSLARPLASAVDLATSATAYDGSLARPAASTIEDLELDLRERLSRIAGLAFGRDGPHLAPRTSGACPR